MERQRHKQNYLWKKHHQFDCNHHPDIKKIMFFLFLLIRTLFFGTNLPSSCNLHWHFADLMALLLEFELIVVQQPQMLGSLHLKQEDEEVNKLHHLILSYPPSGDLRSEFYWISFIFATITPDSKLELKFESWYCEPFKISTKIFLYRTVTLGIYHLSKNSRFLEQAIITFFSKQILSKVE